MILYENRASTILFNFLSALRCEGVFLIPSNVCAVVPLVFHKANVRFEFLDISEKTLCLDEDQVLNRIRREHPVCAGVFFVRTYGYAGDFEAFFQRIKAADSRVVVIDDRCLSVPCCDEDRQTAADLVLYSTGYAKVVDLGHGGFGFLKGSLPYERATLPFSPGALDAITARCAKALEEGAPLQYEDCNWLDTSAPEVPFAEYVSRVEREVERSLQRKRRFNAIYRKQLPDDIQLPGDYQSWRFNIRVKWKEELLRTVFAAGLFASSHYRPMNSLLGEAPSQNAQRLFASVINLFNDRYFSEEQVVRLCEIINRHVNRFAPDA